MSVFQAWSDSTPPLSDHSNQDVRKCVYVSWHNDNLSVLGNGLSWLIIPLPVKVKKSQRRNNSQFLQNSDAFDNANMTNTFSDKH